MSVRRNTTGSGVAPRNFTLVNGVAEQTVFTTTDILPRWIMVYLDCTNLTQNNTIRAYVSIDGTNFRRLDNTTTPLTFNPAINQVGMTLGPFLVAEQFRISMQAAIAEGVDRTVPYHVVEQFVE